MKSPLQGKFLVASNLLQDPNFFRTVVYIVQHDAKGAMGLIVNRPLTMTVREAWAQVSEIPYANDTPLHQGGPCDEGRPLAVHGESRHGELAIAPGLFLTLSSDNLKEIVGEDPSPIKFFVGYAGWTAGQLEAEIGEGSWLVAEASKEQIFNTPRELWRTLMRAATPKGPAPAVDPRLIPQDPTLN